MCRLLFSWCAPLLWMPVVCVSLLLAGMSSPAAAGASTDQCSGTNDHWYSPASQNLADKVPLQCQTCEHPDNRQDSACIVYRMLESEECAHGRCRNEHGDVWLDPKRGIALQHSLRFQKPWKFFLDTGKNCWFILWALEPVVGVEHAGARDQRNYWQAAYQAARHRIDPPIPDAELAVIVQPAHRRSQHQLHLHIGRLEAFDRQAIDELPTEPGQVHAFELNRLAMRALYVPDSNTGEPVLSWSVFEAVQAMWPDGVARMPRVGILLARATDGKGSWVLAAEGLTRSHMRLSANEDCRLNVPQ